MLKDERRPSGPSSSIAFGRQTSYLIRQVAPQAVSCVVSLWYSYIRIYSPVNCCASANRNESCRLCRIKLTYSRCQAKAGVKKIKKQTFLIGFLIRGPVFYRIEILANKMFLYPAGLATTKVIEQLIGLGVSSAPSSFPVCVLLYYFWLHTLLFFFISSDRGNRERERRDCQHQSGGTTLAIFSYVAYRWASKLIILGWIRNGFYVPLTKSLCTWRKYRNIAVSSCDYVCSCPIPLACWMTSVES